MLGFLATSAAAAAPSTHFKFKIPPGWTDLLDNPAEEVVTTLHPTLALQAMRDDQLALAVDLDPGAHGQNSFMQAFPLFGPLEINSRTLPDIRDQIALNSKENELKVTIQSAEIVQFGDADVARIIWLVKNDEGDEMRMAYAIHGGEQSALLIYGANAAEFPRVRPLMEASAMATQGAVPQPRFWRLFYKALPYLQIAGVIGILALLLTRSRKPALITPVVKKAPARDADSDDERDDSPEPGPTDAAKSETAARDEKKDAG